MINRKKMNLPKFYLSRYLRYAPSMMVLVLFIISSFPVLLIDGPIMRYYHDVAWKCHKYWWSALLLIQNYANIENTVCRYVTCHLIILLIKNIFSVSRSYLVSQHRFSTLSGVSIIYFCCLEAWI